MNNLLWGGGGGGGRAVLNGLADWLPQYAQNYLSIRFKNTF